MSEAGHDMDALRRAARSGGAAALTVLGKRLLVGDGIAPSVQEALGSLQEAVSRGGAEAAALLAVCAAWGVGQARNFDIALDNLERAAALGWAPAQHELQLLAREPGSQWRTLRARVDIGSWITAPAIRIVSERPRIGVIERFAAAEECAWLIQRGRPGLRRAMVYRGSSTPQTVGTRTNREVAFTIFNSGVLLSLIRERMSSVAEASTSYFEVTKLLHYEPGQQFALHADFIEPRTSELAREIQARGQRAATFLVYLNDDYEGGETDFPRIGVRIKGAAGRALLFSNVDAAGAPDHDTVHAGLPPTRGEKWLLSQWIRTRPVAP